MSKSKFAIFGGFLVVCVLFPAMRSHADVIVYKQMCGSYAYTDWNLSCKIDKNTFENAKLFGAVGDFKNVKSITICAPFSNRGGLGPLTIVYNNKDGSQFMPTHVFEIVKHGGNLLENKVTWLGMSPRFGSNFRSQGELLFDEKKGTFAYTEIVSSGSKSIGELRAANCNRFFAEEMPEGTEMPRRDAAVVQSEARSSGQSARVTCLNTSSEKAIAACDQVIEQNQSDYIAYYNRGYARLNRGDEEQALSDFNEAIRLNPDYVPAYRTRAYVWKKRGDLVKEIADHEELLRLNENVSTQLGDLWLAKGDRDKAIAAYTEGIRRDPNPRRSGGAYQARGKAYEAQGDYERALADFSRALEIMPSSEEMRSAIKRVTAVLNASQQRTVVPSPSRK